MPKPELGGDHNLRAERRDRFADQLLVRERPVRLGRVEQGDAAVEGVADQPDRVRLLHDMAIRARQPYAAKAERGDLKAAAAEGAAFHWRTLLHVVRAGHAATR